MLTSFSRPLDHKATWRSSHGEEKMRGLCWKKRKKCLTLPLPKSFSKYPSYRLVITVIQNVFNFQHIWLVLCYFQVIYTIIPSEVEQNSHQCFWKSTLQCKWTRGPQAKISNKNMSRSMFSENWSINTTKDCM